jgi:hypothetical protein
MVLEQIQERVKLGQWRMSKHAMVESVKDGLSPRDIKDIILTGKIIESYPERERHLIHGVLYNDVPVHVVIDYSDKELIIVITAYIPDKREWIAYQKRKR